MFAFCYNSLRSYIKLCYVKFKRTNQRCSPSKINVEWCTCKEMVNNSFSESKKNFCRSEERLKYIFPPDVVKYLNYLEVQKNSKVVNA